MFISFLIFCTIVLLLCPTLVWLICWIIARLCHHNMPFAPFAYTGLALVLLFCGTMLYGYWFGRKQLRVTETTYTSPQIPAAFNNYKIVHISDLHLSSFANSHAFLQRIMDTINVQQADLICFTGDFVGFGVEEAIPFTQTLRQLHANDGIMSVLGNHDFALYHHGLTNAEKEEKVNKLTIYQRDTLGWQLLRNQSYLIQRDSAYLQIIGVDNTSCLGQGFQTISRGDLNAALQFRGRPAGYSLEAKGNGLQILLTHDPSHWRGEVIPKTDIPLTLSGHTHAGQVRLFGYPLSSLMFTESEGWYHNAGQSLHINTGLGCTLPIRIGVPPEITVITLQKP
ncbi:MAG: metallophosphoesterase [Paludibacteraceae bacterium]|nr:metallophosphoesterase [Paludibacteraceae bacterium]